MNDLFQLNLNNPKKNGGGGGGGGVPKATTSLHQ